MSDEPSGVGRMAAELGRHEMRQKLLGSIWRLVCSCGNWVTNYEFDDRSEEQQDAHRAHVAAALAEAGIGDVREADERAWGEANNAAMARGEAEAAIARLREVEAERDDWQGATNTWQVACRKAVEDHAKLRAGVEALAVRWESTTEDAWNQVFLEEHLPMVRRLAEDLRTTISDLGDDGEVEGRG